MTRASTQVTPRSGSTKKGFRYVPMDILVSRDRCLKPIDKAVYIVLNSHADIRTRTTTLAVATIAAETPCGVRTAQISIAALIKRGVLEREERFVECRQITSLYRLIGGDAPCYQVSGREDADSEGDVESCAPAGAENEAPGGADSADRLEPVFNENQKKNPTPLTPKTGRGGRKRRRKIPRRAKTRVKPKSMSQQSKGRDRSQGRAPRSASRFSASITASCPNCRR